MAFFIKLLSYLISLKPNVDYLEIWSYKSSERVTVKISFMRPEDQKSARSDQTENYIKSLYNNENEYKEKKLRRDNIAKLNQKFFFNALVDMPRNPIRTGGFSLQRSQIPELIDALTKIENGYYDKEIEHFEKTPDDMTGNQNAAKKESGKQTNEKTMYDFSKLTKKRR